MFAGKDLRHSFALHRLWIRHAESSADFSSKLVGRFLMTRYGFDVTAGTAPQFMLLALPLEEAAMLSEMS